MRIVGGTRNDAVLSCETDAIAITLAESLRYAITRWRLIIDAKTHEGRFNVGVVETTPARLGLRPNRVVAEACCVGALEWCVTVEGPQGAASAELTIAATGRGHPFASVGARPVTVPRWVESAGEVSSQIVSVTPDSGAVVVPARFGEIRGYNNSGGTRYFQTFNAAAVPVDGTSPIESLPIPDGANFDVRPGDLGLGDDGEFYDQAVVWAISTTGGVLTFDAGAKFRTRTRLEV